MTTAPDNSHTASPEAFSAWLEQADQVTARREAIALMPYLVTLTTAEREVWRAALVGRGRPLRAVTFDEQLREHRANRRAEGGDSPAKAPRHRVNVTGAADWRYSTGGDVPRALYEDTTEDGWTLRASLPHIHARIIRRDGSRRRETVDYLLSATEDGPRLIVTDDELARGGWAAKVGVELSSDRDIVTAAGTAIRQEAYRMAPEREAVPTRGADPTTGRLVLAPAECLPDGYFRTPEGVSAEEMRAAMREVVEITARQPGGKMALGMGSSASSPFVGPLRRDPHWFVADGLSSRGKTTMMQLVASLHGDPEVGSGVVLDWEATTIGPLRHLGQLGILPAFFDERGVSDMSKNEWGNLIYSTTSGASRLGAQRLGSGTRRSPTWFGVLFTTGNNRLTDGITSGQFAGIPRRVIELSAPLTANEVDADRITKELLPRCFGWLGPEIIESYSLDDVRAFIDAAAIAVGQAKVSGIPGRIATHLHGAVAGAMMIDDRMGTGNLLADAAIGAAVDYLAAHDVEPDNDADRILRVLAEELAAHRSAWPTVAEAEALDLPEADAVTLIPQRGVDRDVDGWRSNDGAYMYVKPAAWQRIVDTHGFDSSVTCEELYKRKELHVAPSKALAHKWQHQPHILGGRPPVYAISLPAVENVDLADDGPADDDEQHASGPQAAPERPARPAPAVDTRPADEGPQRPAPREVRPAARTAPEIPHSRKSATTTARQDAQAAKIAATREAIDSGRPLSLLAALEGPFSPLVKGRQPYWTAPMPVPAGPGRSFVPNGYGWERPYAGEVHSFDRTGAWVAAATSVEIVHGGYEHTGAVDYTGRPGYYQVTRYAWTETGMPDPLGNEEGDYVWITSPTMRQLFDLVDEGRWPDVAVLDSYTGDPARLREWATYVNDTRKYAITQYGRGEGSPYAAVKENMGQAFSLMIGKADGVQRKWITKAHRPDWAQFTQAQATAMLWRYADKMRKILPAELAPVALINVDEIIIPSGARDIVTTTTLPGSRNPLRIDPDGLEMGTFKTKDSFMWPKKRPARGGDDHK